MTYREGFSPLFFMVNIMVLPIPVDYHIQKKVCNYCRKSKNINEFPLHSHHKDGYDNRCSKCIKKSSNVRKRLKKTAPPKPNPLVCECCQKVVAKVNLDHDHEKETFRGWICEPCNLSIGKLDDSFDGVLNALIYMAKVYEKNEVLDFLKKIKNTT